MIPVFQEFLGGPDPNVPATEWGDCLRACVCSILELPREEVPNLLDAEKVDTALWAEAWQEWLAPLGLRLGFLEPKDAHLVQGHYVIGLWSVEGADFLHNVVMLDGEVVHDPYPGDGGPMGELLELRVFVPTDEMAEAA